MVPMIINLGTGEHGEFVSDPESVILQVSPKSGST